MPEQFADVIVDVTEASLDHSYQYRIPGTLSGKVRPGSQVRVPFGSGRRVVDGYVIRIGDRPKVDPARIKNIKEAPENRVTIESQLIRLALWMRDTYGSSLNNALKTVLPVKEKEKEPTREKVILAIHDDRAEAWIEQFHRRHWDAKARLLSELLEKKELDRRYVTGQLKVTGTSLKSMEQAGLVRIDTSTSWRLPSDLAGDAADGADGTDLRPPLSAEQQRVAEGIFSEWEGKNRPCLIRGVTGSGKTLVYMELIDRVLEEGKQAIVLIPEISLSWQNVRRFRARFGDRIAVLNSKMSRGERADQFARIEKGEVSVAIGPRSALFTPFPQLGLIIIDEEQEPSYRSETAPRYDARETAEERARLAGARLILGSATPSVDSCYKCEQGTWALFEMESRYGGAKLPAVEVVDMRTELREGNKSILSRPLRDKIAERLKKGEQTMLFLNRRGYSGFISCRSCGKPVKCPHCDVSLTLHTNGRLVCHYCGYTMPMVSRCPTCGSPFISGFRAGTEKVVTELTKFFPEARILRMDADTTRKKDGYRNLLAAFQNREADILVGTQMIIKGHDFPNVTLVGVLAADLSLNAGDYRASERTFQLLVQAVGRAGRGTRAGEAVIQTYQPDDPCIQAAVQQDYTAFYENEIAAREMMEYPPACNLLAIRGQGADEERLSRAMRAIRRFLARCEAGGAVIMGPAPENVRKVKDMYREVLYVREKDPERIKKIRRMTEEFIEINSGFARLFFQYDLNA